MAHWLQLFNQSMENLLVHSKFSMNAVRMTMQQLLKPSIARQDWCMIKLFYVIAIN